jgi:hypothetical protein
MQLVELLSGTHLEVQNGGTEVLAVGSRQTKAPPERGFLSKAPTGIEPV